MYINNRTNTATIFLSFEFFMYLVLSTDTLGDTGPDQLDWIVCAMARGPAIGREFMLVADPWGREAENGRGLCHDVQNKIASQIQSQVNIYLLPWKVP